METIDPEKRMWRTLFRIVGVSVENVVLVLPAWDSEYEIHVSRSKFPSELSQQFKKGFRFFGKANIGCERGENLEFSDFENAVDFNSAAPKDGGFLERFG